MVDAAMRADALALQLDVMVGERLGVGEGERDVVQPDLAAGARGLAFGRGLVGERTGVDKGDAVVLVVIADKGDELVFVEQFGAEHRAKYHSTISGRRLVCNTRCESFDGEPIIASHRR